LKRNSLQDHFSNKTFYLGKHISRDEIVLYSISLKKECT
jgi:hypothetical protein